MTRAWPYEINMTKIGNKGKLGLHSLLRNVLLVVNMRRSNVLQVLCAIVVTRREIKFLGKPYLDSIKIVVREL